MLNEAVLNPQSHSSDTAELSLSESGQNSYNTTTEVDGELRTVHVFVNNVDYHVSYNIPPTSGGVIVYLEKSPDCDYNYVIEPLKFGMLPVWAKPQDPLAVKRASGFGPRYSREVQQNQAKHFNCRKETLSQAKSMWNSAKRTRCVVPAQGYFEWKKDSNEKTPYFVFLKSSPLIFFAGLYAHNVHYNDTEMVAGAEYFSSFAIMTGPATGIGPNDMSWLHSRKPIVLKPNTDAWFAWLDPGRPLDEIFELALNTDTNEAYDEISSYVVEKSIGNPTFEGPDAIKEVKKVQRSIGHFFLPKKGMSEVKRTEERGEEGGVKEEEKTVEHVKVKKEKEKGGKGESGEEVKSEAEQKVKNESEEDVIGGLSGSQKRNSSGRSDRSGPLKKHPKSEHLKENSERDSEEKSDQDLSQRKSLRRASSLSQPRTLGRKRARIQGSESMIQKSTESESESESESEGEGESEK